MSLHRCRVLSFLLLIVLLPATRLHAQILQPLPDLDLRTNGYVYAIARQSDGSMVIGGDFLQVNGVSRQYIARLLPDGSLDPDWNPQLNGPVLSLTVDSTSAVYAGGYFSLVDGVSLKNLVKLVDGTPVAAWAPAPDSSVRALAVRGSSLYVGGGFRTIGGVARSCIARISIDGSGAADDDWNPSADGSVDALSIGIGTPTITQGLFAGGAFTTIGGQSRKGIAKLSLDDATADAIWNPSADGAVSAMVNDGRYIYGGGDFTHIGTRAHERIARLSTGVRAPRSRHSMHRPMGGSMRWS